MALPASLERSSSGNFRILDVKQLLQEIHLLASSANDRGLFDSSVYARIVNKLNSAIMSSQGEACSELLKVLDRIEAQIFGEVEQGNDEGCEYDRRGILGSARPAFSTCDCCGGLGQFEEAPTQSISTSDTDAREVFRQQHPPSPVSGQHLTSLSTSSLEFNSAVQDSFQSPEGSVTGCPQNPHSDPPRKSSISGITPPLQSRVQDDLDSDGLLFRRTVRKLETSFVECNSTKPSSANVFQKLDFLNAAGKKSPSVKEFGQSFFGAWGSSKSSESMRSSSRPSRASAAQTGGCGVTHSLLNGPEIACRPLMLVSRASRQRLPRVASSSEQLVSQKQKSPGFSPPARIPKQAGNGSLQCVVKDGSVNYNLWLEETEELLVAKPVRQDFSEDQEVCDQVFAIFSHKCKGKGRTGWGQWGKKDKPVVELLGKLKVVSTVIPEMDRGGKHRHFVDSDFVLLEARHHHGQGKSMNSPLASSGRKVSFSSWDATPTPSESPRGATSSSSESPVFGYFPQASPQQNHPSQKRRTPVKWPSVNFLRQRRDAAEYQWRDTAETDCCPSYVEVAAVVTRIPVQLKKGASPSHQQQASAKSAWESRLKRNNTSARQNYNKQMLENMNVTVVLPAGDHGGPAYGFPGPQPLLERWRSGGNCDCGSWDLGCGLTVMSNQQTTTRCSAKAAQEQAGCLSIVQGKGQKSALKLAPLYDDDTFSVSYQQPLSAFQALGTAVAILHSSRAKQGRALGGDDLQNSDESQVEHKRQSDQEAIKRRSTRQLLPKIIPLRALASSASSSAMLHEALTGFPRIRRVYSLGCHPEPFSLVERV